KYQLTWGKRSEKKYPTGKICGFKTFDKVIYEDGEYFVRGRMSTGYAILSNICGDNIKFKHIPKFKNLNKISARKTTLII
ncbi:MAG: hypothetical protein H7836_13755, partial [Magnetococcus sp. YQC-3]